jgi:3-oxoadipate enol-lactonase
MPSLHVNGIDLYYEVHGEGPPLLLCHGVGSNHLHWWQQVAAFAASHRVINFDHRGFGFSGENGQGPKAFVADALALLDHLRIERAALLGQSMGGVTAGGLATLHPQRVDKLILSCTSGGMVRMRPAAVMKQAIERSVPYPELVHISVRQDGFPRRHPALSYLFEAMAQINRHVDMQRLKELPTLRHDAKVLAAAATPVLLLAAEEDDGAQVAMQELQELLPRSVYHSIANAGHLAFFESAETYNRLVLDFLA